MFCTQSVAHIILCWYAFGQHTYKHLGFLIKIFCSCLYEFVYVYLACGFSHVHRYLVIFVPLVWIVLIMCSLVNFSLNWIVLMGSAFFLHSSWCFAPVCKIILMGLPFSFCHFYVCSCVKYFLDVFLLYFSFITSDSLKIYFS